MKISSEIEVQRRVSSLYYSDGFTDINLGIVILFIIPIRNSMGWLKYGLYIVLFAIGISVHFIKRAVAFPRVGVMVPNFKIFQSTKVVRRFLLILISILLIAFVYFVIFPLDMEMQNTDVLIDTLVFYPILLSFVILAVGSRCYRFLIHFAISSVGFILEYFLQSTVSPLFGPISIALSGVAIISIGIAYLIKFLRKYPVLPPSSQSFNQTEGTPK